MNPSPTQPALPLSVLVLVVACGGAMGASARFLASEWIHARTGVAFPWGTFAVNLSGCLLLGLAYGVMDTVEIPAALRPAVTVGFLGAFTTFSAFSWEALTLVQEGAPARALLYVAGSVAAGLVLVALGVGAGRLLPGGS